MNIFSYNIRGGGISSKIRRVSYLIQANKIDLCFIQDTKLTSFCDIVASSLWGNKDVDWTVSNSIGVDGGMTILWIKGSLNLNYNFVGKRLCGDKH